MKRKSVLIILLLLAFELKTTAQTRWIEDSEMKFKIAVPNSFQTNKFKDGTDQIHAFVSSDQNVAIQLRSFKVAENATIEIIMQAFLQNILKGAQQLVNKAYTLNGLNGNLAGYKWRFNNINVIAGVFYTIQNGIAYAIMTVIPENLFSTRNAESDAITNTFTILNPVSNTTGSLGGLVNPQNASQGVIQNQNAQLPSNPSVAPNQPSNTNVAITDANIGAEIDANYRIINPQNTLASSVGRINLAFGYSGNAKGKTFLIKWYSDTHNTLVKEFTYSPPDAVTGRGKAYIENPGKVWPEGKYRVNICLNDQVLKEVAFSLEPLKQSQSTPDNDYIPLVAGDACLEHLIPKKASIRQADQGQKLWNIPILETGKNLTMVIQNILKQGKDFNTFVNEQISVITGKGATITKKELANVQGINGYKYWYEYNGTFFLYSAIEGPQSFYLTGFVGGADYKGILEKHHNVIHNSFKKVPCVNEPSNIQTSQPTQPQPVKGSTSGAIKQIVFDNQNNGYDFATEKIRNGYATPEPDLRNEACCTPLPALCGNWAKTGKTKMEDVTSPPVSGFISDGKSYTNCQECPVNEVLVFKLKNGTYAKLMITNDVKTKTADGCQHKITCLVQYPAF